MATAIVIPALGESISEGVVQSWRKPEGAYVQRDEIILDLETDKITVEIPASVSGVLHQKTPVGETVRVGALVGEIDESAAPPASAGPSISSGTEGKPSAAAAAPAAPSMPAQSSGHGTQTKGTAAPSGAGGAPQKESSSSAGAPLPSTVKKGPEPLATPLAKKMADDAGIDLSKLTGTGPGGRIREQDVAGAMQGKGQGAGGSAGHGEAPDPGTRSGVDSAASGTGQGGSRGVRRERMSPLRQRVAVRLVEAQHTAAMLTTFNECDMTKVMALRAAHKDAFEKAHGVKLGFMSFFVKAAVSALRKFPNVNAYIVPGASGGGGGTEAPSEIEYHDYCDIAVAVGTEKGLVVPVVRNCESMSFADVERGIGELSQKARDNKLTLADMQGGTFTISNGGVYGSMMSTPILNPPQSGILGMHNIIRRPVENPEKPGSGEVVVRPMMYLALSYDHRIVDGAGAVGFLKHVRECIEDPARLMLGV
ncbi:MAG TPA: 2-oxoglutarate dehydrogenase complex dihydrolipoyllysine-residue succinyltransferase [Phycisphaerales bacterium]|nr:2-oxoglutarate dehydrogenase complex dihydrolipoyllysine-residue succinyltransferase [Phycisphaerales bacterium]